MISTAHRPGGDAPHPRQHAENPGHQTIPADLAETLGLWAWRSGGLCCRQSTIRRVPRRVDSGGLDARLSSWMRTGVGVIGGRRVIAVEDETMRAARGEGDRAPHLPAAPDRAGGVVVGGRRVSDESNGIPALRDLLEPLDLERPSGRRRRHGAPGDRGSAKGLFVFEGVVGGSYRWVRLFFSVGP